MKILITGATGFIGRGLIREIKSKYNVVCMIRKENQFLKENKIKTIICDLNDNTKLLNNTKHFDVVIHLAGIVNTSSKIEFYNKNVKITKNLLDACKKNKIKKFIFISTAVVISPVQGPYSKSKLEAEKLVINSGLKYVILRPSLVYGKEDKKNIGGIIKLIKKYPIFPLIGGSNRLQPIYIGDVINIIIQSVENKKSNNKIYFVAGSEKITFKEMIQLISKKMNKKILMIPIPSIIPILLVRIYEKIVKNPVIVNEQMARLVSNNTCDISETEKDFKFKPISIKDGINKLIN